MDEKKISKMMHTQWKECCSIWNWHKDGKQWHGKSKHMDEVVFINESQNMELIMKEIQFNKDSFDHTNAIVSVNEN